MNTWSPLWSGIVESSLWAEDDTTVKVFITMLALKDSDHVCRRTAYNLARTCNKTEEQILAAIKVLESPDTRRIEPQPHEGRRIKKVEDGWLILNGEFYREKVSREREKARWRRSSTNYRERKKAKAPTGREVRYTKAVEAGDQTAADAIAAEGLPAATDHGSNPELD